MTELKPRSRGRMVTISFGGGMGGVSRHYYVKEVLREEGTLIEFRGWKLERLALERDEIIIVDNNKLYRVRIEHFPPHRIQALKDAMSRGDFGAFQEEACRTARDKRLKPTPLSTVKAVGNWHSEERPGGPFG